MASPAAPPPAARVDLWRSALDHALAEITGLRARLGARDRELRDSYQGSLREIELWVSKFSDSGGHNSKRLMWLLMGQRAASCAAVACWPAADRSMICCSPEPRVKRPAPTAIHV